MIDVRVGVEDKADNLFMRGDIIQLLTDTLTIIHRVYYTIHEHDKFDAVMFSRILKTALDKDVPFLSEETLIKRLHDLDEV